MAAKPDNQQSAVIGDRETGSATAIRPHRPDKAINQQLADVQRHKDAHKQTQQPIIIAR
jgi:hypothetical protein